MTAGVYVQWLENWLHNYRERGRLESDLGWEDDPFLYNKYSLANSPCEVALEIYSAIQSQNLSLDQLTSHISTVGTILHDTNVRAIANQPQSLHRRMLSVVLPTSDVTNYLLECQRADSYAYVYLLVRLLFEILLHTKSLAIRAVVLSQIKRNFGLLKFLLGLVVDPYSRAGCEFKLPKSYFMSNALANVFIELLRHRDLNLLLCGVQLTALAPTIIANEPLLLNELRILLLRRDDGETNFTSAAALAEILPCTSEFVQLEFLNAAFSSACNFPHNVYKVHSFIAIALGVSTSAKLAKYACKLCCKLLALLESNQADKAFNEKVVDDLVLVLLFAACVVCPNDAKCVARVLQHLQRAEKSLDDKTTVYLRCLLHQKDESIKSAVKSFKKLLATLGNRSEYNSDVYAFVHTCIHRRNINHKFQYLYTDDCDVSAIFASLNSGLDVQTLTRSLGNAVVRAKRPLDILQELLDNSCRLDGSISAKDKVGIFNMFDTSLATSVMTNGVDVCAKLKLANDYPLHLNALLKSGAIGEIVLNFNVNCGFSRYVFVRLAAGVPLYSLKSADSESNVLRGDYNLLNGETYKRKPPGNVLEIVYYRHDEKLEFEGALEEKIKGLQKPHELYQAVLLCFRLGKYGLAKELIQRLSPLINETHCWFNALHCLAEALNGGGCRGGSGGALGVQGTALENSKKSRRAQAARRVQGLAFESFRGSGAEPLKILKGSGGARKPIPTQTDCYATTGNSTVDDSLGATLNYITALRRSLYSLESLKIALDVSIARGLAYDKSFTKLNYYTCNFALQGWCSLLLVLRISLEHLGADSRDKRLYSVLFCVRAQFLVYKYLFRRRCPETCAVASILEALATVALLHSFREYPITFSSAIAVFESYVKELDPSLVPFDALEILKALPPLRCRVVSLRLLGQNPELTARNVWNYFAVYCKRRFHGKLHYFQRSSLYRLDPEAFDGGGVDGNLILKVYGSLNLPVPIGVLKAYPLPFAAISMELEVNKRDVGLSFLILNGCIRNCEEGFSVPWICIFEVTSNGALMNVKIRLASNCVSSRLLINLAGFDVEALRFVAIPLGFDKDPIGFASPVYKIGHL